MAGAKLVCIAGPAAGTEHVLTEGEVVVGRANDATVSIPDTSVSRRHARLFSRRGQWCCEDLGSGNGTLVNGDPVEGEAVLRNGDVLTLGDTELRFVQGEAADNAKAERPVRRSSLGAMPLESAGGRRSLPSRADGRSRSQRAVGSAAALEVRRRNKKWLGFALVGVGLLLALLLGAKAYLRAEEARAQQEAAKAEALRQKLGSIFQAGKNLVRDGKWREAKAKFLEVKQLAPNDKAVDQFLEKAEKEIPNELALEEALAALEKNALGDAARALARVSPQTQLFDPLRTLSRQLEDRIEARLREGQAQLQAAPSGGEGRAAFTSVVTMMEDVLQARPQHRDAKVLRDDAQDRLAQLDRPSAPRPPPAAPKPWDAAVEAFRDGDLKQAQDLAGKCGEKVPRCRELVRDMKAFAELQKRLEDLDAKGLAKLLQLDREITSGSRSKLARNAETRAGSIFYKSAAAAKASGQWAKALEFATKALDADSNHAGAKAVMEEVRAKAKDVFLLGYSLKDSQPEEALEKFREVLQMTPKGDEYNAKAAHWIEQLGQ